MPYAFKKLVMHAARYATALVLVCGVASCAGSSSDRPEPVVTKMQPVEPKSNPEIGAWYGRGEAFPDGHLCIVVCENQRIFLGDKLCDQIDAGDFQQYFRYERKGNTLETTFHKIGNVIDFAIQPGGEEVRVGFSVPNHARWSDLPLKRVSRTSVLCTDPARREGSPTMR